LTLSGGGSRAIAFHLGCFRALNDLGILSKVEVLSTVSGGSVVGTLYAYGKFNSFGEFDSKVVEVLRRGLQTDILKSVLFSTCLPKILATVVVHGLLGLVLIPVRWLARLARWCTGWNELPLVKWLSLLPESLPVWGSLTTAFERSLEKSLYSGITLGSTRTGDIEVVINACELKTGTAFRFGSSVAGGWRYGSIVGSPSIPVSKAVAASAAFPALLPPLIEEFEFEQGGIRRRAVVSLTDGGVYDNLGVTAVEPRKNPSYSITVHNPTHIICLNAGPGQFSVGGRSFSLSRRLLRSFDAVFRKAQDAAYARLHAFLERGDLRGFALIYLGQNDAALPAPPSDLVTRDSVREYPTDFAAMSDENIERLSKRGEQLTRLLVSRYLPDL
jgi:NTE family protein